MSSITRKRTESRSKFKQATFEVYIKIFGKKIHITNVDAARYDKPEFEFSGPQPIQASVDVALPDGSKKTIFIKPRRPEPGSSNRNGSSCPQNWHLPIIR